jgi:hypothetical protein
MAYRQIIIRARQNFIWNEYLKTNPQIADVDEKVRNAWKTYAGKILPPQAIEKYNVDVDFTTFVNEHATADAKKDEKFSMHVNALKSALSAINERNPETYFTKVKDVYLPILDKEVLCNHISLTNSKVRISLNCPSSNSSQASGRTIIIMICYS